MSRRRKAAHAHGSSERWLVSYADFITLLFAFFVVLYASSRSDKSKARRMAASIEAAFTQLGMFQPEQPSPSLEEQTTATPQPDAAVAADRLALAALEQRLSIQLQPEIARGAVSLNLSRQGLVIRVQQLGFFKSGSDQLSPTSLPMVQRIGSSIAPLPNPVRIEGFTDNVPIHNQQFASNWELSTARAATLVQLFISQYHVDPERLSAAGYGQYHPVASNATSVGRQRNRRVDVVVVSLEAARVTAPVGAIPGGPLSGKKPVVDPARPTILTNIVPPAALTSDSN